MSVSHRAPAHILLLSFLVLLFPTVSGRAQQPAPAEGEGFSAWWYPLGNPQANRNNPAPTASQQVQDLQFKWRTGRLKNSPVVLVGGIRTQEGKNDQQIVGVEEGSNRVTILTSTGFVDTIMEVEEAKVLGLSLRLTGLFNTAARTAIPTGRPNAIGIGIRDWSVNAGSIPFGLLMDGSGRPINRLGLRTSETQKLSAFTNELNRRVTISPVAAYTPAGETTPVAVALVSQDHFVLNPAGTGGRVDSMINSVRKYSLVKGRPRSFADSLERPYLIGPNPYFAPPALFVDPNGNHFISLSTRQYRNISPGLALRNGINTDLTPSDSAVPLHLNISTSPPTRIAYEPSLVVGATGSTSLFATLILTEANGTQTETPLRFFFEQQVVDGNDPRVQMATPTAPGAIDNFIPTGNPTQSGWTAVIADLDGRAPGYGDPGIETTEPLVNNPGNELVLTTQPEGSGANGKNWVYVFRYNAKSTIQNRPFYYFTRQLISGRVVAAGDIVADEYGRQELLVAHEDSLFVLQLKPYNLSDDIQSTIETQNRPFYYLDTFAVDSPILSVAIADLEGDGENDIVVCTERSTYAIGKLGKDHYEFTADPDPFGREYCPDDTIMIAWKRNVGSEDTQVQVNIVGESLRRQFSQSDIAGDRVSFIPSKVLINSQTFRVQPGEYRLVVSNLDYPYIADTSRAFTIVESSIAQFDFANAQSYEIGSVVKDTIALNCIDSAWVQRSIGDTASWNDVRETVTRLDEGRLSFADTLVCPEILRCGADEEPRIYYRIVTATDTLPLREVRLSLPRLTFDLQPGGASLARNRSLEWNAADFPCTELTVSLSSDNGKTWTAIGEAGTASEFFEFTVPDNINDFVLVCIQCSNPEECGYGVQRFAVSRVDMSNYVYPNPFDPEAPGASGDGAEIVYSLKNSGIISIIIYDASRSVVQEVVKGEERSEGRNRGDFWDGKNSTGQNVANGTYICVISSSSGEQIILPIAVVKRR